MSSTFEQKPPSAVKQAAKDDGDYIEVLIEKYDKDADHRKMLAIHKKAVNSEIVRTTDEGTVVRFRKEDAEAYQKTVHEKAAKRSNIVDPIQPDSQFAGISKMGNNSIEQVSHQELISG
jgi:hypothetical protein